MRSASCYISFFCFSALCLAFPLPLLSGVGPPLEGAHHRCSFHKVRPRPDDMKNVHGFFDNGIAPASLIDFLAVELVMARLQVRRRLAKSALHHHQKSTCAVDAPESLPGTLYLVEGLEYGVE